VCFRSPAEGREGTYWSALAKAEEGNRDPLRISEDEAIDALEETIADATRLRMISDVPLGAFLSGGIDSSLVVAAMQTASSSPVRTFTIGFREEGFDEAAYAREVAAHLGTEHTELYLEADEALALVPKVADIWDEPFADPSQLPTYLVSRLAAEHVTVCLSGDGGDEIFGGYRRYFRARRLWRGMAPVPRPLRRAAGKILAWPSVGAWNAALRPLRLLRAGGAYGREPGDLAHKLATVLAVRDETDFYRHVMSQWKEPTRLVPGAREPATALAFVPDRPRLRELTERMMALDTVTYLPGDILCKVDRASMANSLEARVPLLDHRVVELAGRLPARLRIGPPPGKRLLRAALARHVPRRLFERPKQGFGIPIGEWLGGPLRDWAEALLTREALGRDGLLHPEPIRRVWADHLEGQIRGEHALWNVLMFQAWRERWFA